MMIYFDTNVLIYTVADQGDNKTILSKYIIKKAIIDQKFFISELVLIEFIYALSKLKILDKKQDLVNLYSKFCQNSISKELILSACRKCQKLNKCKNINDFIHLEIANENCEKIVTFDSDFRNLQQFYNGKIEILKDSYERFSKILPPLRSI